MKLSSRSLRIPESGTFLVKRKAAELRAEGKDVIDFGPGEPDFETFPEIIEAGKRALDEGFTRYSPAAGHPRLREAVADYHNRKYGSDFKAENVFISVGGKGALYHMFMALVNEGDEVIIPAPYWVSYPPQVELCGGKSVIVETKDTGLVPTAGHLQANTTNNTAAAIFSSPSNPTGRVVQKSELSAMARWAKATNSVLISDECYAVYDYEGLFCSAAEVWDEAPENLVISSTFSKPYSMTGWRVGYCIAQPDLIKAMGRLQSHTLSNTATMAQIAAAEAMALPDNRFEKLFFEFKERRDTVVEALNAMPGVSLEKPEGAFYAFPSVQGAMDKMGIKTSKEFCDRFLKEALVAAVPGEDFGAPGSLRISYALEISRVKEALLRMEKFVKSG